MSAPAAPAEAFTAGRLDGDGPPAAVPWATVLPLAVVLCLADGFWATSLRGAVGAIEHTQAPFATWLRESALLLPLFVAATVAGLLLALRRFGPAAGAAGRAAAVGLVAGTTALAGIAVIAVHGVSDYRLQAEQLRMMASMPGMRTGALAGQQHASLMLQVKAVGYGTLFVVVTNLLLVGWLVALRGGRLDLATARAPGQQAWLPAGFRRWGGAGAWRSAGRGRLTQLRLLLAAGLLVAAGIHAACAPRLLSAWPGGGLVLVALVVAEIAVADRVLHRGSGAVYLAAAVIGLVAVTTTVLGWAWPGGVGATAGARSTALAAVAVASLVAAAAVELGVLVLGLVLLWQGSRLRERERLSPHAVALSVVGLLAAAAVGLTGAWTGGSSGAAHHHAAAPSVSQQASQG